MEIATPRLVLDFKLRLSHTLRPKRERELFVTVPSEFIVRSGSYVIAGPVSPTGDGTSSMRYSREAFREMSWKVEDRYYIYFFDDVPRRDRKIKKERRKKKKKRKKRGEKRKGDASK